MDMLEVLDGIWEFSSAPAAAELLAGWRVNSSHPDPTDPTGVRRLQDPALDTTSLVQALHPDEIWATDEQPDNDPGHEKLYGYGIRFGRFVYELAAAGGKDMLESSASTIASRDLAQFLSTCGRGQ
jgi:hypothetical protein